MITGGMTLEERITRGAELLDARVPGWRERVDVQRLDLSSDTECVLGHVLGSYARGLEALGLTPAQSWAHGFTTYERAPSVIAALTSAWVRYLRPTLTPAE